MQDNHQSQSYKDRLNYWDAETLDADPSWKVALSELQQKEITRWYKYLEKHPRIRSISHFKNQCPSVSKLLLECKDHLDNKRGVFLLQRLPLHSNLSLVKKTYVFMGNLIGTAIPYESYSNDKIAEVKHSSRYKRGAFGNHGLSLHTDGLGGAVNYIALLCVHPSSNGGMSRVASGAKLYDYLSQNYPELSGTLESSLSYKAPDWLPKSYQIIDKLNLFQHKNNKLFIDIKYNSCMKNKSLLSQKQIDVLEHIKSAADNPMITHGFDLQKGDIIFINNRHVTHSRTEFSDAKRFLLRIWIE